MIIWVPTHDWRPMGVFSTLERAVQSVNSIQEDSEQPPLEFEQVQSTGSYITQGAPSIVIMQMQLDFDAYERV